MKPRNRNGCLVSLMDSERPTSYGNEQIVSLAGATVTKQVVQLLRAQGQDNETEMVDITLGIEIEPEQEGLDSTLEVVAIVKWGTGTGKCTAEIDWKLGTQFAVPCSYLEIDAVVSAIGIGEFKLTGNIAWGSGSRTYATRTLPPILLDEMGVGIARIPHFACRFFPLFQAAAGAITVEFLTSSGGVVISGYSAVVAALVSVQGAEIPNTAKFVRFTGAAGELVVPYFILSL